MDTLTIVRQMRSMVKLQAALSAELNATLVDNANRPVVPSPLVVWLRQFPRGASRDTAPF